MDKDLIKMRNIFREAADIIDELLEVGVKEASGQDVKKESESIMGRFVIKTMELQSLESVRSSGKVSRGIQG